MTLEIPRGGFVAVVGDNGSGKTTLCKTFNGLVPHYWAGECAGEVMVDGVDSFTSTVAELSANGGGRGGACPESSNRCCKGSTWTSSPGS